MIGTHTGFLFDVLPLWLAAALLELGLLCLGMVLDETYVNRTTLLTGALALGVHAVVAGGVWLPVSLYLDVGLVVGAYGLYAYVVDGYVANWFRVLAYFGYSPLTILLVVLLPDVVFPFALALAGYANLQLMASLRPTEPYYFGPEHPDEYERAVAQTAAESPEGVDDADNGLEGADGQAGKRHTGTGTPASPSVDDVDDRIDADRPRADATPTGGSSTERGILPEFMRRL